MLKPLNLILMLGLAGAGGYLAYDKYKSSSGEPVALETKDYEVAAPGVVEPKSGEIRLGSTYLGRVEEVLVSVDDKVEEGELLLRLNDAEARAKLASAETDAEASREDSEKSVVSGREDVRKAEDAIYSAERAVTGARIELDYAIAAKRSGNGSEAAVSDARRRLKDSNDRLERERIAYVKAQSKANLPAPNTAESRVSAARAQVRMAEALLDRTRIRAPSIGTILQFNAKQGEIVAPSPDLPLIVMGDMSIVRVKAEVDEGDVGKISMNQSAYVTSVSLTDKIDGKVTNIAPTLGSARIGPRGPRRVTDVEVMEVTIELQGTATGLKPGMRVDAFFRKN